MQQEPSIQCSRSISYPVTRNFVESFQAALIGELSCESQRAIQTRSYVLVNSDLIGETSGDFMYNCYGYVLGYNDKDVVPGHFYHIDYNNGTTTELLSPYAYSSTITLQEATQLILADLQSSYVNKPCVSVVSSVPTASSLYADETAICYRHESNQSAADFHFVKLMDTVNNRWYHKPGQTAVLSYKYTPSSLYSWSNECYYSGRAWPATIYYWSDIVYIIFNSHHTYDDSASGTRTCLRCGCVEQ